MNGLSGLLGGPTIAGGINAALAHPGAPSSVTGSPSGASNSPVSINGSAGQQIAPAPGSYVGAGQDSSAPSTTTSSGVSPLDPHASAMAAYQAAMNGMGTSSGVVPAGALAGYQHALTIRGAGHHALNAAPPAPLYNPMQDPSVLHALGLD